MSPGVDNEVALPASGAKVTTGRQPLWALFVLVAVAAIVVAVSSEPGRLPALLDRLRNQAAAEPFNTTVLTTLGVAVLGTLFVPLTALIAAVSFALPPGLAFVALYAGALASASLTWWLGKVAGLPPIGQRLVARSERLRDLLRRGGFVSVLVARMLPVGNFALFNLLAGSLDIRFGSFVLGNAVGLLPGLLGVSWIAYSIRRALASADPVDFFWAAASLAVVVAGAFALRRWVGKRNRFA
jgi:uncharacterized membrane protein YdjX (TVP38/TMEM64 family)